MPGGHSEWVPPLPIPNRTVKPLSADDSTDTRAKVGHRQAPHQGSQHTLGAFLCSGSVLARIRPPASSPGTGRTFAHPDRLLRCIRRTVPLRGLFPRMTGDRSLLQRGCLCRRHTAGINLSCAQQGEATGQTALPPASGDRQATGLWTLFADVRAGQAGQGRREKRDADLLPLLQITPPAKQQPAARRLIYPANPNPESSFARRAAWLSVNPPTKSSTCM